MSRFLDIARPLAERGFRVFPLIPAEKRPFKMSWGDHFDAATTDVTALEQWDGEVPSANVGISPDENFCFLETDDEASLRETCADLPPEIWDTARVSARDNRCYYIFRQTMRTRKAGNMTVTRAGQENLFEFKQHRVYVTGPGSIHPKTGKPYGVEWRTIPAMPDVLLHRLCELYGAPKATDSHKMDAETARQTALLDSFLGIYEVPTTGDWFNKGKQWYRPIACPWESEHENANQGTSTCIVYTEGSGYGFDCKHRCASKTWKEFRAEVQGHFPDRRFNFVEPTAEATIGSTATAVKDWRTHYHTLAEFDAVKPPQFLIDGILQLQAILMVAAFVGQKKTLLALNLVWSLLTGNPLFGKYEVLQRPSRVIYLGPENGLISFKDRLVRLGLREYVGKTLFFTTMNLENPPELYDLPESEAIKGAAVLVDTLIRYSEGNENDSAAMKVLAGIAFALIRKGAAAVIVLHHSRKSSTTANEITLENCSRGSGELVAFVSAAIGMRTQDMDHDYESASLVKFVKQRDFEANPSSFEVVTDRKTCLMSYVDGSDGAQVTLGNTANKDGKDDAAIALMKANTNIKLSNVKMAKLLKDAGFEHRSKEWVRLKRLELGIGGLKSGTATATPLQIKE